MANLSNINNKFLVTTGGNVLIGQTSAVGSSIFQVTGASTLGSDVTMANGNVHIHQTGANYLTYIDFLRSSANVNPTARIHVTEPAATHTSRMEFYTSNASGSVPNLRRAMFLDQNLKAYFDGTIETVGNATFGGSTLLDGLASNGYRIYKIRLQAPYTGGWGSITPGTVIGGLQQTNFRSDGGASNIAAAVDFELENNTYGTGQTNISFKCGGVNGVDSATRMLISSGGVVTVGASKRYVDSANTQFDLEVTEGMAFAGAAFTYATIQGDSAGHGNIEICANAYPANTGVESRITFKTSTNSGGQYTDALVIKGPNVGIGTNSPSNKLDIVAAGGNTNIRVYDSAGNSEVGLKLQSDAKTWTLQNWGSGGDKLRILDNSGNTIQIWDNAGNVGIGTTDPICKLDVKGPNTNNAIIARFYSNEGARGDFIIRNGVGTTPTTYIGTGGGSEELGIGTNNTERLRITAAGIIKAFRGNAGDLFFADNTSSAGGGIINYNSSLAQQSNNTSCSHFKGTTQNIASYHLYGNGSSSWSSDSRLKRDIKTTRNGYIDDINKLRVVKYKWKNDENSGQELGLIAQEVEKIFPSLVVDNEDAVGNGKTYKSLKYSILPTILLKGMQEQQKMIQELKAEIELLKNK